MSPVSPNRSVKGINCTRKRIASIAFQLLVIAFLIFPAETFADDNDLDEGSIGAEITISTNNKSYSLYARQAKLSDILYELGAAADFELKIFEVVSDDRSDWDYESMALTRLLDNLLRDYNTVMLYENTQFTSKENTDRKLKELWLIASDDAVSPVQPSPSKNIEIELEQPVNSTGKERKLTAEQRYEISFIDNLEGMTGSDVVDTLNQTLMNEDDPLIRKRAVTALGDIGGIEVLDAIETGMGDTSSEVRTELAKTIAQIKDQRSMLLLGQLLMGDHDSQVRQQAVRGLYQQNTRAARSFVESALADKDPAVKKIADEILQQWTAIADEQ